MTVENQRFQSLDGDQRRDTVNTRQRFGLFREAKAQADGYRGSMAFPLRLGAPDPRAFAVHRLWMSRRADRDPLKGMRDAAQARAVADLVARHLPHLPFHAEGLRSFPRDVVEAAAPLFAGERSPDARFDG